MRITTRAKKASLAAAKKRTVERLAREAPAKPNKPVLARVAAQPTHSGAALTFLMLGVIGSIAAALSNKRID